RLVAVARLHTLSLLVALPPVPAPDQGEAEADAAQQPEGVAAQPVADPFALFVVVVDFVDCHAVSRPARARAASQVRMCVRAAAPEPACRGIRYADGVSRSPARANRRRIP